MEDVAGSVLVEHADAGAFVARGAGVAVVVVDIALLYLFLGERPMVVVVEIIGIERDSLEMPAHSFWNGSIFAKGALENASKVTSWLLR